MKKIIFALFAVFTAATLEAQISELLESGTVGSSLTVFGGAGPALYGYTDLRYVGSDKGDYRKTGYRYGGLEFKKMGFGEPGRIIGNLLFGGGIVVVSTDAFSQKSLYEVVKDGSTFISASEVPPDGSPALLNKTSVNPEFFFGFNQKWYSAELGMTFMLTAIDEKHRVRLSPTGTETQVDGRGWIWSESSSRVNFSVRLGLEDHVNMRFDFMRNGYDPVNGTSVMALSVPILDFARVDVGSYLEPNQAVYVEPLFSFKAFSFSARAGTIVSTSSRHIERLAIEDSFFGALSFSYSW